MRFTFFVSTNMNYVKLNTRSDSKSSKHTFIIVTAAVLSCVFVIAISHFSNPAASLPFKLESSVTNGDGSQGSAKSDDSDRFKPAVLHQSSSDVKLSTGQGQILGKVLESREGRKYFAFYDVPYAKPPVGELRFKSPQPAEPWSGIRDGTRIGLECIQKEKYAPVLRSHGREDCLYLNVYTPKLPTDGENPVLPVMVYIHGGEFKTGNGSRYGAEYFMDQDVVIITFEFRLGPLGFLSTDDDEIRGNMGLKDCIMVLRWVQQYVKAYGGDPNKVTIFGNSSGGTMVHALMLSNMSKGLFHRAISESGTALLAGGPLPVGKPFAVNLARQLGCPDTNSTKAVAECLRSVDAETIVVTESPLILPFPVLEKVPENGDTSDVLFSRRAIDIVEDLENFPMKVPYLLGDNSAEELSTALQTLKDPALIEALNTDWAGNVGSLFRFRTAPSAENLERIKKFYFPLGMRVNNRTRNALINMLSDQRWVHNAKTAAVAHAKHSPTYLYWLTKEPARSYAEKYLPGFDPPYGVNHADELQFLFLYDGYPEIPIGSQYTRFSQMLVQNWVHFANTGKPLAEDWEPVDAADNGSKWYELGDECGETRRLRRRMRFWDDFRTEMYY